jgi:hypothetical protein
MNMIAAKHISSAADAAEPLVQRAAEGKVGLLATEHCQAGRAALVEVVCVGLLVLVGCCTHVVATQINTEVCTLPAGAGCSHQQGPVSVASPGAAGGRPGPWWDLLTVGCTGASAQLLLRSALLSAVSLHWRSTVAYMTSTCGYRPPCPLLPPMQWWTPWMSSQEH